jgi:hypothetical protein
MTGSPECLSGGFKMLDLRVESMIKSLQESKQIKLQPMVISKIQPTVISREDRKNT